MPPKPSAGGKRGSAAAVQEAQEAEEQRLRAEEEERVRLQREQECRQQEEKEREEERVREERRRSRYPLRHLKWVQLFQQVRSRAGLAQ